MILLTFMSTNATYGTAGTIICHETDLGYINAVSRHTRIQPISIFHKYQFQQYTKYLILQAFMRGSLWYFHSEWKSYLVLVGLSSTSDFDGYGIFANNQIVKTYCGAGSLIHSLTQYVYVSLITQIVILK